MGKKTIGIEALVTWAYREQRVDRWAEGRRGLLPGEAKLEAPWKGPREWRSRLEQQALDAELGTDVQRSGLVVSLVPEAVNEDARVVHALARSLDREMLVMLVMYGRMGRRPDGMLEQRTRYVPRNGWYVAEGKKATQWGARHGERLARESIHPVNRRPFYCQVMLQPDPREIAAARTLYATWWEALSLLQWYLAGKPQLLGQHQVTDELPPEAPALRDYEAAYVRRTKDSVGEGEPTTLHYVPADRDIDEAGWKRMRWTAELPKDS